MFIKKSQNLLVILIAVIHQLSPVSPTFYCNSESYYFTSFLPVFFLVYIYMIYMRYIYHIYIYNIYLSLSYISFGLLVLVLVSKLCVTLL